MIGTSTEEISVPASAAPPPVRPPGGQPIRDKGRPAKTADDPERSLAGCYRPTNPAAAELLRSGDPTKFGSAPRSDNWQSDRHSRRRAPTPTNQLGICHRGDVGL